jgi:hypothetical protein
MAASGGLEVRAARGGDAGDVEIWAGEPSAAASVVRQPRAMLVTRTWRCVVGQRLASRRRGGGAPASLRDGLGVERRRSVPAPIDAGANGCGPSSDCGWVMPDQCQAFAGRGGVVEIAVVGTRRPARRVRAGILPRVGPACCPAQAASARFMRLMGGHLSAVRGNGIKTRQPGRAFCQHGPRSRTA